MISVSLFQSLDKHFKDLYRVNQLWFEVRKIISREWEEKEATKLLNLLFEGEIYEVERKMREALKKQSHARSTAD